VIRFPDEELELELDEEELELDEEELELDEEELELELDELELDELELLDEDVELDELLELELVVPPQPEMTDASKNAKEPRATLLGKIDFGKALIICT
jgi:hypothetical protein